MVGEGGFEPPKLEATDLQSAPFTTREFSHMNENKIMELVDGLEPPRPADYKSAALPTELHQLVLLDLSN